MHRTVAKRGFDRDIGGGWEAWKAWAKMKWVAQFDVIQRGANVVLRVVNPHS